MNDLEITILTMKRLPGDGGTYCTGKAGRTTFTAGLPIKEWNVDDWQIGLLGGAAVADDHFKEDRLEERHTLARRIRIYLNRSHRKGAESEIMEITVKQMKEAGEEINRLFNLDPPIDISLKEDELKKSLLWNTNPGEKYPDVGVREDDITSTDPNATTLSDNTLKCLIEIGGIPEHLISTVEERLNEKPDKEKNVATKKKTATKKKAVAKKKPVVKKETAKTPSNKATVFGLWNNGKGMTDPEKIAAKIKKAVRTSTIKSWIKQWIAGNNLPACAKK